MLTHEAIVAAAARVMARDGYAGLTMRAIADELGVQAPALYWYFGDKRALELALFAHLMEGFSPRNQLDDWRDQARQAAQDLRAYLRSIRDITRLRPQGLWVGPNMLSRFEEGLGTLMKAGLSPHDAVYAHSMLLTFVFQWAAAADDFSAERAEFDASAPNAPADGTRYPNIAAAMEDLLRWDPDGHFAFRLDVMIAGLERRIGQDVAI